MTLPHPVLLAAIGGTYARFSVLPEPGGRSGPIWKVPTTGFPGPVDAIRAFVDRQDAVRPRSAFLAVAGRITTGITRLTNAPWRFDPGGIGESFGLEAVRLVNDYVPLAAALTVLDAADPTDLARSGQLSKGPGHG